MKIELTTVHAFCDKCGTELTDAEKNKNLEHSNKEFPICDGCFEEALTKIKYIGEFR